MTHTSEHDKNPRLYTWADVENKQPTKPAKTQFKITLKPSATRSSRLDLPVYESEVQRALRHFENSPVMRQLRHYENIPVVMLQRQIENNPVFQVKRIMDSTLPRISEPLLELERIQRLMRPFDHVMPY